MEKNKINDNQTISANWMQWYFAKFIAWLKQFFQIIYLFIGLKPEDITKSLSKFYTQSATKWESTRKKPWPEFDLIRREIESYVVWTGRGPSVLPIPQKDSQDWDKSGWQALKKHWKKQNKKIVVVELWCGDGRFAQYLDERFDGNLMYMWFDCSVGLVDIAQQREYKNDVQFTVGDMVHCLRFLDQQSVDIVISIASIQHLHRGQRRDLRNQVYRVLQFDWLFIATNRCYSRWMLKKRWLAILAWVVLQLVNHATFGWWDYMISFKDENKISYRYYHLFLLGSLVNYCHYAWFHVKRAQYVSGEWQLSDSWYTSRNTFIVAEKAVINE